MDGSMSIAHVEFGEIAAFLLEEDEDFNENNQKKNESPSNLKNTNKSKNKFDNKVASTSTGNKINKKGVGKVLEKDVNKYLTRTFLAQYALSEIPTLEDDVRPFPEIIKTGKSDGLRRKKNTTQHKTTQHTTTHTTQYKTTHYNTTHYNITQHKLRYGKRPKVTRKKEERLESDRRVGR